MQTLAAELKAEKIEPWLCELDVEVGSESCKPASLPETMLLPSIAAARARRLLWTSAAMFETAEYHFYGALSSG